MPAVVGDEHGAGLHHAGQRHEPRVAGSIVVVVVVVVVFFLLVFNAHVFFFLLGRAVRSFFFRL